MSIGAILWLHHKNFKVPKERHAGSLEEGVQTFGESIASTTTLATSSSRVTS